MKFYTQEGNWDVVGNDIPVFFIQDAIKFPDFVHAVKPEPHNEVPQGQSAHNNFWDFVGLQPECEPPIIAHILALICFLAAHMVMWAMSDRGKANFASVYLTRSSVLDRHTSFFSYDARVRGQHFYSY